MSEPTDERPAPTTADASPDEFGVRVDWQSEAVRMEAAEFLVATRAQQERRLRIARNLDTLRVLDQAAP